MNSSATEKILIAVKEIKSRMTIVTIPDRKDIDALAQACEVMAEALQHMGKWCTRESDQEPCKCIPHACLLNVAEILEGKGK
jgi:hypothetical protein